MKKARTGAIAIWVGAMAMSTVSAAAAQTGNGLIDPSVCIAPITLLVLVLTPTATLSEAATAAVNRRLKHK